MINSVMSSVPFPIAGDSTKVDTSQNVQTNSEIPFEQVLSILMAQIGMFTVAQQPNTNDMKNMSNSGEENIECQPVETCALLQPVVANDLGIDMASVQTAGMPQIIETEQITIPEQSNNTNTSDPKYNTAANITENETTQNSSPANVEGLQGELILRLNEETVEMQIKFVEEQSNSTSPISNSVETLTEGKNTSTKSNDSIISVDTPKNTIATNSNQSEEGNATDINAVQKKLQINNAELLSSLPLKELKNEETLTQRGNLQNISTQIEKLLLHTEKQHSDKQQDLGNTLLAKGQQQLEDMLIKTKENLLVEDAISKFDLDLGNQNTSHSNRKMDVTKSADSLLITSSLKSTKETLDTALPEVHSILPSEPQEVVSTLSSLKSVLTEQIKFTVNSGLKTVRIKLEPESLGMLEIKIQEHSGKIGIQLSTPNNEVQKVLSQNLPQLWETLKHEGIFTKDVQVISTGTMNLMLNQEPYSHQFSQETHSEPVTHFIQQELEQNSEETKSIPKYHDGALNLWI